MLYENAGRVLQLKMKITGQRSTNFEQCSVICLEFQQGLILEFLKSFEMRRFVFI